MRGFSRRITALAALLASTSTTALAQEAADGANNDDEIVVTAQRRDEALAEELKREAEARQKRAGNYEQTPFEAYGEPLRNSDPDLFTIIYKAFRLFVS